MSLSAASQSSKSIYTTTWFSVVVQTQAHTLIHSNNLSNALSLGADCIPRVAETPWLHSATPTPSVTGRWQLLLNGLLAGRETTLFKIQMTRQRKSFFLPQGGWGGGYRVITHRAFCRQGSLNGGFQSGGISGWERHSIKMRSRLRTLLTTELPINRLNVCLLAALHLYLRTKRKQREMTDRQINCGVFIGEDR